VRTLTTSEKGGAAELRIAAEAARLGIVVSRPLTDGGRYDLVFDLGRGLQRIQCKWSPRVGETVVVRARTNRCTPAGYVRGWYGADESTRSPRSARMSSGATSSLLRRSAVRG